MIDQVKFTAMKDGDKEDYDFLTEHEIAYTKGTASRLLDAMVNLDEGLSGYQITRLGHSLQSATRAERDGADTDWIVAALLHDIGDIYAPYNHDEYAATILKPFVREQVTWVVEKHGAFQMNYYGEHVGADPHQRDDHDDPANDPEHRVAILAQAVGYEGRQPARTGVVEHDKVGRDLEHRGEHEPEHHVDRPGEQRKHDHRVLAAGEIPEAGEECEERPRAPRARFLRRLGRVRPARAGRGDRLVRRGQLPLGAVGSVAISA